jgi:predicted Na+-dependent transporter
VFALIAGAAIPWIGYRVGQAGHVAIFCVVGLFFIAGLRLKTDEAKKALASIKTCFVGLLSILVLTCIIGAGLTEMLPIRADFKLGLIIFFCTPCTVNTGAMYARQAGGNFAMALLLTVAGNVLGIFTCPIMLHLFADFERLRGRGGGR